MLLLLKYCDLQDNHNHQKIQGLINKQESNIFPFFAVKSLSCVETYSVHVTYSWQYCIVNLIQASMLLNLTLILIHGGICTFIFFFYSCTQFNRKFYPYIPWQGGKVPLCVLSKGAKENDPDYGYTICGKGDIIGRNMN